jgi:glycosyltransferase involved in cell wall biosynthesis
MGFQSGVKLHHLIQGCRFSVLPSEWYENNPSSIIESFSFRKPVIGSRISGIPELIIDNKTGLTFEPANPADLRKKIEYLFNSSNQILEMGENAKKFVDNELNSDIHYRKLMHIYESTVESRCRRA